jgi:hypothetical protein
MNSINPSSTSFYQASFFTNVRTILYEKIKKIASIVFSFPRLIIKEINDLCDRLIDPNWRYFVQDSRGHFSSSKDKKNFYEGVMIADELFKKIFNKNEKANTHWKSLWKENHHELLNTSSLWEKFHKSGTCFGNCSALASKIIEAGKVLKIEELRSAEADLEFSKTAIGFQLLTRTVVKINRMIMSEVYDKTQENIVLGAKENTLLRSQNELLNLRKKTEYVAKQIILPHINLIKTNPELISSSNPIADFQEIFPSKPSLLKEDFYKKCNKITQGDFSGVFFVTGVKTAKPGHQLLLEVDNSQKLYILYDNNRGFYQFKTLDSCLSNLEKRCQNNKYEDILVLPVVLA